MKASPAQDQKRWRVTRFTTVYHTLPCSIALCPDNLEDDKALDQTFEGASLTEEGKSEAPQHLQPPLVGSPPHQLFGFGIDRLELALENELGKKILVYGTDTEEGER